MIKRGVRVYQRSSPRNYFLTQSYQDIAIEMNQLQLSIVFVSLLSITPLNICYGLRVCAHPHSYSEIPMPTVMVLGGGAFESD